MPQDLDTGFSIFCYYMSILESKLCHRNICFVSSWRFNWVPGTQLFPCKSIYGRYRVSFLGGAIAGLAISFDMPLILVVLCLMFVIETLSDIIQVSYFKLSGGKRVFKMAPFHHHLEMGGWTGKKWSETELFTLYLSISTVCAIISFMGIYNRF